MNNIGIALENMRNRSGGNRVQKQIGKHMKNRSQDGRHIEKMHVPLNWFHISFGTYVWALDSQQFKHADSIHELDADRSTW